MLIVAALVVTVDGAVELLLPPPQAASASTAAIRAPRIIDTFIKTLSFGAGVALCNARASAKPAGFVEEFEGIYLRRKGLTWSGSQRFQPACRRVCWCSRSA